MEKKLAQPKEETVEIPLTELKAVDVSEKNIERMARGFIMGTQAMGRRREIRQELEAKVTKKIGKKGKYLTDKLFELIEGVYIVDKKAGKNGRDIRYYLVPPSLNAIIYALDRVLGKPAQFIEHSEEKRGIILVEHVIKNLAMNPYAKNGAGKNNVRGEPGEPGEAAGTGDGDGKASPECVDARVGTVAL